MNTPHAPARATFTLTADQAHDLHRAATPWHSGSQARADPIYRDRLNNWWAALGLELGFKWTTVADLTWLAADGHPCAISEEQGEGFGLPDPLVLASATFTAEPEAAAVPDELDPQAMAWMAERYRNSGPITFDDKWSTLEMATAFAAGRDKGFAMNSATVEALEKRASDATAARSAVSRWMVEGQALLREAAAMFRAYEQHHQTKLDLMLRGPRGATEHGELLGKVRRNAQMASRLESYLEAFNYRWEAVGDPRRHMRIWPQPFGESRPITQADCDRLTDAARKGPKLTGEMIETKVHHAIGRVTGILPDGSVQFVMDDPEPEDDAAPIIPRGFTHAGEEAQRFSTNDPGFDPRQFVTINGFMFTPQFELEALRQLLADAMPAITFVNGLATIEDADLDTFAVAQLRNQARGAMGDEGFKRPGAYTEAQWRAACSIFVNWWTGGRSGEVGANAGDATHAIAEALGLRRAS